MTVPGLQPSSGQFGQLLPHLVGLDQAAKPLEDFQAIGQALSCLLQATLPFVEAAHSFGADQMPHR